MTWRRAPAGFVSGPRKLKIVRTASSRAHRDDVARRRVVGGREHEAEADLVDAAADGLGGEVDPGAERLEHVGRAATARSPSGCRAWPRAQPAPAAISAAVVETLNVGRPPPVPAVSTRSSRAVRDRRGQRAHRRGQAGELVLGLALRPQRDQERRRSASPTASPAMISAQDLAGLAPAPRSRPGGHRVDRRRQRGVRHRRAGPSRKLASSRVPSASAPTRDGTGRPRRAARGGGCP